MKKKSKRMKPKGAEGKAVVKRLGRTYKTGGFNAIENEAAEKYGSKAAGQKVAGAVYWNKVKKRLYGK